MNEVRITGRIEPTQHTAAIKQLEKLLNEVDNPVLIYHGDAETAEFLASYCATRTIETTDDNGKTRVRITPLPFTEEKDPPRRMQTRDTASPYFILLGLPSSYELHTLAERGKYQYLSNRTAQVNPRPEESPRRQTVKPTGKKAKRSRSPRSRHAHAKRRRTA